VTLVRHEADDYFHLVLKSGVAHMIAESPSSACARGATPYRRRQMRKARMKVRLCSEARVVGVAFFEAGRLPNASATAVPGPTSTYASSSPSPSRFFGHGPKRPGHRPGVKGDRLTEQRRHETFVASAA
jgi:hypothetical protein